MALKKIGIVAASALCSINLWTGAPLFAVWVGSKVQGNLNNLSMTAVFSVVVVLAALVFLLAFILTWLNGKYDEITGRPPAARQTSPWLRSMRDERSHDVREKYGISAVERVVVITVVAAVLAFEVWFFFFAGSSLPNG
jgi:magnesium-transporting ATPase (P-type)